MAPQDYYNVLGIEKNAQADEIKRAYRNLARRWHPDRNPLDADAELRFKEIKEAYDVLSDPDRRRQYDRLGPLFREDGRPPTPEDLQQVVSGLFTALFGKNGVAGEDLRYTLSLTLEEVLTGCEREVVIPRQVRCKPCGGVGSASADQTKCDVCGGTGSSKGRFFKSKCFHCQGKGFTVEKVCDSCGGEGRRGIEDRIRVKVPKGVATGQKLKVAGKGNAGLGAGKPGDLYVIVSVCEHPLFRRRGDDLMLNLPLSVHELIAGTDLMVPTLDGDTKIRIPTESQPGKILRLAHRGLPRVGRNSRGDLHLQLELDVPHSLTKKQIQALADWEASLPASAYTKRQAFRLKMEERS